MKAKNYYIMNTKQYLHASIRSVEGAGDDEFEVVVSSDTVDRHEEIVDQDGLDFSKWLTNAVFLWAHDYGCMPVAKGLEVKKSELNGQKVTVVRGQWAPADANPQAGYLKALWKGGFLNTTSIGFIELERQGNRITKSEILEVSFVPVPANPQAVALLRTAGFDMTKVKGVFEEKTAVAEHDPAKADEGKAWDVTAARTAVAKWASSDGSGDKDKIEWSKYKEGFAWYNEAAADSFGSYKLPHHDVEEGKLVTVWKGVAAAMAALLGGRGGTNIPEDERKAVYNHLKNHYEQFDKQPPDYKSMSDIARKDHAEDEEQEMEAVMAALDTLGEDIAKACELEDADARMQACAAAFDKAVEAIKEALEEEAEGDDETKGVDVIVKALETYEEAVAKAMELEDTEAMSDVCKAAHEACKTEIASMMKPGGDEDDEDKEEAEEEGKEKAAKAGAAISRKNRAAIKEAIKSMKKVVTHVEKLSTHATNSIASLEELVAGYDDEIAAEEDEAEKAENGGSAKQRSNGKGTKRDEFRAWAATRSLLAIVARATNQACAEHNKRKPQ